MGERVVTLIDVNSIDTLAVTVQDCTDTTNLFIGTLDSTIVVNPAAYQQIALTAADTVGQGDNFWVGVTLADKFGNVRGKGLYQAIELVSDHETLEPAAAQARLLPDAMKAEGILIGLSGRYGNVLKIRPPLVFDKANADQLLETLDRVLQNITDNT